MRAVNRRFNTPTQVRYVRGGSRPHPAGPVQEWKSDLTGRSYEVFETNSYEQTEHLGVGSTGYLQYRDGTAYVTRNQDDPLPDRPVTPRTQSPGNYRPRVGSLSNLSDWIKWGLPGALVILVLWHLVGP